MHSTAFLHIGRLKNLSKCLKFTFCDLIVFYLHSIQRTEVNMDSGCRASAVHIVAFGVLMGFRRSPLKLCL